MSHQNYKTLHYDGRQGEVEFVASVKGRPFAILTSSNFPTPDVTLVDYSLIRDLKLAMTDLQCAKFNFAGQKLRKLGKISTSVQCISDGKTSGNLHFKATVVQDLYQTFDTHSIAGNKLSKLLLDPPVQPLDESSTEPTQETPQKKKPKLKKTSPSNSSPSRSTSEQSPSQTPEQSPSRTPEQSPSSAKGTPSFNQVYGVSPSSSVSGSPPGYPHPLYQTRAHPHLPWEPDNQRSPLSVNISRLTATFGNADVTDDYEDEQAELVRAEPSRDYDFVRGDRNSSFAFATYSSSGDPSYLYRSGHGRQGCRKTCRNAENPPNNCGYHSQWQLPLGFQYCGQQCRGGLCQCLQRYQDCGYYG